MKKANVQAGDKFNSWTIIEEVSKEERDCDERRVRAKCDCGYIDVVNLKNIRYGKSKQCVKCRLKISNEACVKKWEPIDAGDYYLIPLNHGMFSKIDKEDLPKIRSESWRVSSVGYAASSDCKRQIHRIVNCTPDGMCTDHINGDKLDNRKINLRTISRSDHIKHHYEHISSFKINRQDTTVSNVNLT